MRLTGTTITNEQLRVLCDHALTARESEQLNIALAGHSTKRPAARQACAELYDRLVRRV